MAGSSTENIPLTPDEHFAQLLEIVRKYNRDEENLDILEKAYRIASQAHKEQKRASGEPYINHPLEAAKILAEIRMDTPSLAAAILHDVIEDTNLEYDAIKHNFGKSVADLVDGVTKLTAISASKERGESLGKKKPKVDNQAENLRKIFLAMAKDIRVILIKVADRLHNLRTLGALREEKRKFIAQETLEIFAPITSRLGMWEFKWQLEDLAFSHLEPEKYKQLAQNVYKKRKEREELVQQVENTIRKNLFEVGINDIHIEGRPKHLYSIYKKMLTKHLPLDEIYDLLAVRVIVDTVRECYQVLGIVHSLWMPFQNRFKDYIAMPKSNSYRSLHTTIYGPGNQPVEVQIRTWEMHRVNEYGIAAHWAYKENNKNADVNMTSEVYPWIRRILDWEDESKNAREYIENLKLDLLDSEVFVFTPKGEVVDLRAGSTPIDFAYRIHTQVGHRCIGAKVNSKIVPIEYKLKNADIVEILTSKHGTPSLDWLKIAQTNQAKNKIKAWFKKEKREENIIRGRETMVAEIRKNRLDVSVNNQEIFGKIAERYNFKTIDDLFASVGYGETSPVTIMNRIQEILPAPETPPVPEEVEAEAEKRIQKRHRTAKSPIRVKGVDNLMTRFAHCCSPVWGDEVIGYITLGKGVSVHRKDCPNYTSLSQNPERLVEVYWVQQEKETIFTVELEIQGYDRTGILSDILNVTNDLKFHIRSTKAWVKSNLANIKLTVDLSSKEQLNTLIKSIKKIKDVNRVFRATSANK